MARRLACAALCVALVLGGMTFALHGGEVVPVAMAASDTGGIIVVDEHGQGLLGVDVSGDGFGIEDDSSRGGLSTASDEGTCCPLRLLVSMGDRPCLGTILASGNGTWLLGFEDEEGMREAEQALEGIAKFVVRDQAIYGGDSVLPERAASVPFADLAAMDDFMSAEENLVALVGGGVVPEAPGVVFHVSTIEGDAMGPQELPLEVEQGQGIDGGAAQILMVKAFDETGWGSTASVYAAIEGAIRMKAKVIVLSFATCAEGDAALAAAVDDAFRAGIIVVGAAGDAGEDASAWMPANLSERIITIGACDRQGLRRRTSNYGALVDGYVCAESSLDGTVRAARWLAENSSYGAATEDLFSEDGMRCLGISLYGTDDAAPLRLAFQADEGEGQTFAADASFHLFVDAADGILEGVDGASMWSCEGEADHLAPGSDTYSSIGWLRCVREGYDLVGFFAADDADQMVYDEDGMWVSGPYWQGLEGEAPSYAFEGDLHVVARWRPRSYPVLLQARFQRADGGFDAPVTVSEGAYRYQDSYSWSFEGDETYRAAFVTGEVAGPVTECVDVERNTWKLELDPCGGVGEACVRDVLVGASASLEFPDFHRSCHALRGFSEAEDGSGNVYVQGDVVEPLSAGATRVLYAVWERTFSLCFDANAPSAGVQGEMEAFEGLTRETLGHLTLPDCGFTRMSHQFVCWCDARDGSGMRYAPYEVATSLYTGDDIVLYALWEPEQLSVVVPVGLTLVCDEDGQIEGPVQEAVLANGSSVDVAVAGITVEPTYPWRLVEAGEVTGANLMSLELVLGDAPMLDLARPAQTGRLVMLEARDHLPITSVSGKVGRACDGLCELCSLGWTLRVVQNQGA